VIPLIVLLALAVIAVVVVGPAANRTSRPRELGDGLFDAAGFVCDAHASRPVRLPREVS
jgi:hypothetical protein